MADHDRLASPESDSHVATVARFFAAAVILGFSVAPCAQTPTPTSCDGPWQFVMDPANPVLTSVPGTWEEMFGELNLVKKGSEYYLYYAGREPSSQGRIGLAISSNGSDFTRQPSWVLDNAFSGFDSWNVCQPRALWFPGTGMRLWYAGLNGLGPYADGMGEADSPDGISSFTRHPSNPQWDTGGPVGGSMWGNASTLYDTDDPDPARLYKQYFAIDDGGSRKIGLITSPDGVTWTWYGYVLQEGGPGDWDELGIQDPVALRYGPGTYLMVYRERSDSLLGVAVSQDGLSWTKQPGNPIWCNPGGGFTTGALDGNTLHLWRVNHWDGDAILHMWAEVPSSVPGNLTSVDGWNRVYR